MNQLSGKLIVNITSDLKTEQNIIAGIKIKYCDSEHIEMTTTYLYDTIQWVALIANISQEREVNTIYYIYISPNTATIGKDVLDVVKRILSNSNVSLIVMSICEDIALFRQKQIDLIAESSACFYFNSDMKYKKIK
jgi:hypothetical protein